MSMTRISIHALFAEGDVLEMCKKLLRENFYPRPLRRGRPVDEQGRGYVYRISIHALFAEGDSALWSM